MALTYAELESVTNDYFLLEGGKASDIYFKTSFFMDYFMKKKKGIMNRYSGGSKIRVPLMFDRGLGDAFVRADALTSDDQSVLNAAYFYPKNYYANATIYRTDELENAGEEQQVDMVAARIQAAQNGISMDLANSIYDNAGDTSKYLTGLGSLTNTTTTTAYGGIAEDDLVASDGTKPWLGETLTTLGALSLANIRTLRSTAKLYDGPNGKPDVALTTETLFNVVKAILQPMQRFTEDQDTTKAGFENLVFEGCLIAADDFCPSGYMFALNSKHIGFAVHKKCGKDFFDRDKWMPLAQAAGRTMKIFWHGNIVCNNRKAHIAASSLT